MLFCLWPFSIRDLTNYDYAGEIQEEPKFFWGIRHRILRQEIKP